MKKLQNNRCWFKESKPDWAFLSRCTYVFSSCFMTITDRRKSFTWPSQVTEILLMPCNWPLHLIFPFYTSLLFSFNFLIHKNFLFSFKCKLLFSIITWSADNRTLYFSMQISNRVMFTRWPLRVVPLSLWNFYFFVSKESTHRPSCNTIWFEKCILHRRS